MNITTQQSERTATTWTTTKAYDNDLEERVLARINELKTYQFNWDCENSEKPKDDVLNAMACLVRRSFGIISEPLVTPIHGGNVQFEWHKGSRTLEMEFEGDDQVRYLKWDSSNNIDEEDVFVYHDDQKFKELIKWFDSP